jgi:hypothetical protein
MRPIRRAILGARSTRGVVYSRRGPRAALPNKRSIPLHRLILNDQNRYTLHHTVDPVR